MAGAAMQKMKAQLVEWIWFPCHWREGVAKTIMAECASLSLHPWWKQRDICICVYIYIKYVCIYIYTPLDFPTSQLFLSVTLSRGHLSGLFEVLSMKYSAFVALPVPCALGKCFGFRWDTPLVNKHSWHESVYISRNNITICIYNT